MSGARARWIALAAIVVVMVLLHQDAWQWRSARLVLGFLPIGLAWHVGYCVLASGLMWALVRFAWPSELERGDDEGTR